MKLESTLLVGNNKRQSLHRIARLAMGLAVGELLALCLALHGVGSHQLEETIRIFEWPVIWPRRCQLHAAVQRWGNGDEEHRDKGVVFGPAITPRSVKVQYVTSRRIGQASYYCENQHLSRDEVMRTMWCAFQHGYDAEVGTGDYPLQDPGIVVNLPSASLRQVI